MRVKQTAARNEPSSAPEAHNSWGFSPAAQVSFKLVVASRLEVLRYFDCIAQL